MGAYPNTTLSPVLTELATEFLVGSQTFIASKVLRTIGVRIKAAQYPRIIKESLLKDVDLLRTPRSAYNRTAWEYEMRPYSCVEYGHEQPVDDSNANFHADMFDEEMESTEIASDVLARQYERRVAAKVFNPVTWTAVSVTNEWDDATNATPLDDINTGRRVIRDATGIIANTLIIGVDVFNNLGTVDQIVNRVKYSVPSFGENGGKITAQLLAQLFGLDQVLVGDASRDTVEEGLDSVLASIWSNEYAMLCRCALNDTDNIKKPCIGRTFLWEEDSPALLVSETYREEATRSNVVRVRHTVDEKITLPEAGYLMDNITT